MRIVFDLFYEAGEEPNISNRFFLQMKANTILLSE